MSKTLILMRHAKSSWGTPALDDHDRPLSKRGRRSATALGEWMHTKGWLPDQVLSSSSVRTRETFAGLGFITPVHFTDDLFHAEPTKIRRVLATATGQTVLLLGHNPGIAELAEQLVETTPDHPKFHDYPSGATLIIRFDIEQWDHLQTGDVLDFTTPRDLMKQ